MEARFPSSIEMSRDIRTGAKEVSSQIESVFRQLPTDPAYVRRVAPLAYRYWQLRGSPLGSPNQDWFLAEREIARECEPYGPLSFGDGGDRPASIE